MVLWNRLKTSQIHELMLFKSVVDIYVLFHIIDHYEEKLKALFNLGEIIGGDFSVQKS